MCPAQEPSWTKCCVMWASRGPAQRLHTHLFRKSTAIMPKHKQRAHQVQAQTSSPPQTCSSINNLRDLADSLPSIQPGRVIRSAAPAAASLEDANLLFKKIGICDLIDLRSSEEQGEDAADSHIFSSAAVKEYRRSWTTWQLQLPPQPFPEPLISHRISLLERGRYYVSLSYHLPLYSTLSALAWRAAGQKESSRLVLLKEVNDGGLLLLYKVLVDSARPEIVGALRLIISSLEQGRGVMVFCKAGKDRTGIIAMLLLHCAGASHDQIINDYHKSDAYHQVALAGIENRDELRGLDRAAFERAPKEAMGGCLRYIEQYHGSISAYLERIGFSAAEQARLKELLTSPALPARA